MRNVYRIGDDLFVALAFMSFIIGVILRMLGILQIAFGITTREVLFFSMMCLLFSISLSLYDLNIKK